MHSLALCVLQIGSECLCERIHSSNEDTSSAVSEALPLSETISHSYTELFMVLLSEVARSSYFVIVQCFIV